MENIIGDIIRRITFAALLSLVLLMPVAYAVTALDPVMLNNIGYHAYQNGEIDIAGALFSEALSIDPGYVKARENRAVIRNLQSRYEEAADDLEILITSEPGNAQYQFDLGANLIAKFRAGSMDIDDFMRGYDAYVAAAAIDPDYPHAQQNLAVLNAIRAEFGI